MQKIHDRFLQSKRTQEKEDSLRQSQSLQTGWKNKGLW